MEKKIQSISDSTNLSLNVLTAEQAQSVKGGGGYTTRPSSGSKYSVQNGSIYLTANGQTFKMT